MPKPMPENPYGVVTLCRICVANVPQQSNATIVKCEWCGRDCWRQSIEPDPLPQGVAAACTDCAIRRAFFQRTMDLERWNKENP